MDARPSNPTGPSRKQRQGWWRWASIGCGVVVLVLVVALIGGLFSSRRMMVWGVGRLGDRVMAALPQDTPAAVREELRRRLNCVVWVARERRASEQRLGEFAKACIDALADKSVSADEEEQIATAADRVCREGGGGPPP
jgi:hypothetical protein